MLAGRVVESAEVSDRFLWDFRRTLADLYASEFYGTMDDELHKLGMQAYSEASGVALEIPEDTLLNKSHIDIPMAEFWVRALHPESMYYVDVRGAASAAHVYGKPLVATETFTGGGYESPYTLKKIADYWFTQGVNRLVFHTSAQQPLDTKPGNTMVGTHINRNITWAEHGEAVHDLCCAGELHAAAGIAQWPTWRICCRRVRLRRCRSGARGCSLRRRRAMTMTMSTRMCCCIVTECAAGWARPCGGKRGDAGGNELSRAGAAAARRR